MLAAIPLMLLPVIAYNILVMTLDGGFGSASAQSRLIQQTSTVPTASGAFLSVNLADMFLVGSLLILCMELLRASTATRFALASHSMSMLLFMICVAELMLLPAFATSTFFMITLMVLMDVLARATAA